MVLRQVVGLPIGILAAVVGVLPWVLTGGHLPVQNLWATDVVDAGAMPFVLLPFSQYAVPTIVALVVTGSAAAGIAARRLPGRRLGIAVGLLVAQPAAIIQSAVTDGGGLQHTSFARLYLVLLVAVCGASFLAGAVVLLLIALAPPAGVVVAVALAAVPFGAWAGSMLVPFGSITVSPVVSALLEPLRFLPAVLIGAVIAWAGVRSAGRVIAAVAALLILWIGAALETAVVSSAGSRVYAHDPAAMLQAGGTVFRLALLSADASVPPLVLVLVVVLLGRIGAVLLRGRREPVPPG